jgi:flagellar hook-associated protein 1 FlgK
MKSELLTEMEVTFNEPSESGFTTIMNEFFNSLQDLAGDPGSLSNRSIVRQRGVTLAKYFNSTAAHFEKMQDDINQQVRIKVEEINSLAGQIQQLNRQIYMSELDGNTANDLRDKRTLLVDRMSEIINVNASEVVVGKLPDGRENKHFIITISGKAIVDHYEISKLAVEQRDVKLNAEDIDGLYEVKWADGNTLNIKSGELRGLLDIRDGNSGINGSPNYKGIPFYQRKLNEFVRTFAMAINEGYIDINGDGIIQPGEDRAGHADGYGLDPDGSGPGTSPTGIRFFTMLGNDGLPVDSGSFINGETTTSGIVSMYDKITAKNFAVSMDIMEDVGNIATSDTPGETGNINNLKSILGMRHDPHMFTEGSPEDFMKSLITTLAIDSQQASHYSRNQEAVVQQIENRRISISGVSIDEEMANMVKFQHAYNAAAKMIATLNEVYEILINGLGL